MKIRFPLDEAEKEYFRKRLDEVLNRKNGCQIIILWDENKLTDYYQNICIKHLLERIKSSAKEYAKMTDNKLIEDNID